LIATQNFFSELIVFLKKMSVMLKTFEQVDPNKLSNAIWFRNGAESLGLVGDGRGRGRVVP
jgi:hypothetical protein